MLGTGVVAVPELDLCSVSSAAAGHVHALAECLQGPVSTVPRPTLRARAVTVPELDRGTAVRACTGVVDTLTTIAADRSGASVLPLDYRWCVEVITGVDRLGEAQVLPLGPVERGGAARRPSKLEAGNVRAVPDLFWHEVAVVGRVGHGLEVDASLAAIRELVLAALARKDRPKPSEAIGSAGWKAAAITVALAVVVMVVAVEVDVAAGHGHLHAGIAVRTCGGRGERGRYVGVVGQNFAQPDEIEEAEVNDVMSVEAPFLEADLISIVVRIR